tara:strand:- start:948 stop:1934 length:987 start_codon:yes stop_codon:yes gene_type:complete
VEAVLVQDLLFTPDIRVDSISCYLMRMEKPWSYEVTTGDIIPLYILLEGKAWLHCQDDPPWEIKPGTAVALTRPSSHLWSQYAPGEKKAGTHKAEFLPIDDHDRQDFFIGDENAETPLFFVMTVRETSNLVPDIIPPIFVVRPEDRDDIPGLWSLLSLFMRGDVRTQDKGTVLKRRLIEAVCVLISIYGLNKKEAPQLLGQSGCYDDRIRRVLSALHGDYGKDWTLDQLSELANMSRSGLSERFKQMVGDTPLNYLSRIRMQRAASLLRGSTLAINQIAGLIGYQSESAFNKAFSRRVGHTPGRYRELIRRGDINDFNAGFISRDNPE